MKKLRVCESCGKKNKTVEERWCGYHQEVDGKKLVEIVCDACEQQHLDDI